MKALLSDNRLCLFLLCLVNLAHVSAQTIAAGDDHTVSICSDSTVRSWGRNQNGQLGNGTTTGSNVPVQVSGLTGIIAVAAGKIIPLL